MNVHELIVELLEYEDVTMEVTVNGKTFGVDDFGSVFYKNGKSYININVEM